MYFNCLENFQSQDEYGTKKHRNSEFQTSTYVFWYQKYTLKIGRNSQCAKTTIYLAILFSLETWIAETVITYSRQKCSSSWTATGISA